MARRDPRNLATFWQARDIAGLNLMRADFTTHDYATHTHDCFVIAVTEAGGARVSACGNEDAVSPSRLFVANPDEPQSARMGTSGRWQYRAFYVEQSAMQHLVRALEIRCAPHFACGMLSDTALSDRFIRLHRALETDAGVVRSDELLIDTFGTLLRRYGDGRSRPALAPRDASIARSVIASMRARHAENLSLGELADSAGLSSFQLIDLFKRTVGLTPHAFLIRIRLEIARDHLRRGIPVAASAMAAGFYDQSALHRHFKRWYGITPLQFVAAVCS